jgi:hypothetical protein
MRTVLTLSAAALILATGPAVAHHSFAMFDQNKEVGLSGTVSEFQWSNPHSWVELDVPTEAGGTATEHWSLEAGSIHTLSNLGWKSKTLKPGDKIAITINPMKNGSRGGALQWVTFSGGQKISGGGR